MTANADALIRAAQLQYEKNASDENQIALLDAKAEKEGILAQVEGFRSEQLTNQISLQKELAERTKEEADYTVLRRYMVFVKDWDFGHFFHYGNHCFNQWKAGDCWDLKPGIYHGSANAGINPKITIHWSGETK